MDDIEKLIKDAQLQVEQEEKFKEEQRIYEEEKAKEAELIRQAEEIYVLPASPVIPIIHSSEYTDIESTTTHAWFTNLNSNGYNTLNPNGESQKSISTPFILEVKKSFKLSPSTTRFLFGVSLTNSIQVTGQVSNTNYFFTENHFYKLENNEIPIDLGTSLTVNKIDPQEALDRTVAVVKKVNEKVETKASGSLKATNDGTDLVDISSMTGTSDRTVLTTEHYVDNKVLLATQDMTGVINTKLETKADGNLKVLAIGETKLDLSQMTGLEADGSRTLASVKTVVDVSSNKVELALSKTLTLHFDDGTTEDIKVG